MQQLHSSETSETSKTSETIDKITKAVFDLISDTIQNSELNKDELKTIKPLNTEQTFILQKVLCIPGANYSDEKVKDYFKQYSVPEDKARQVGTQIYNVVKNCLEATTGITLTIEKGNFVVEIEKYIDWKKLQNAYDLIADIRNKFLPILRNRCSRINILGTSINTRKSHKIGDFFVNLSLKYNDDVIKFSKLEDEIKETLEVSSGFHKILIQGKQGSGKTTLLKHIAIKFAEDKLEHTCVPIFISLKRFSESKDFPDLFEFLARIFSNENVSLEQLREILVKGKALLLLDGLDSNPGIHTAVSEFIEKYSSNTFVITCNKEESHLSDFKTYKLQGFNQGDIGKFVKHWFSQKNKTPSQEFQNLIKDIDKSENNSIKDFASSPLLLQFLCLIYLNEDKIIENLGRMCLYQKAMFALVNDLDEESGFDPQDEIYRNISSLEKVNLISYLAIKTLETGKDYIPVGKLSEHAAEFISKLPGAKTNWDTLLEEGKAVIQSIEIQDGLLVQKLWGDYTFAHTTIQDFFVSSHISSNLNQWETWLSRKDNPRWQNIFKQAKQLLECNKNPLDHLICDSNHKDGAT